jgi:hypothetical protein
MSEQVEQAQNAVCEIQTLESLNDLPVGTRGIVRQLRGGREFTGRVVALGFTPGTEVEVMQNTGIRCTSA